MSRWRRQSKEDGLSDLIAGIIVLYILFLVVKWFTNKTDFLRWLFYGLGVVAFLFAGAFVYRKVKKKLRQKKLNRLLEIIRQAGLEDYIKNFISRFGLGQEKSKNIWMRRNYKFDWNRIRDLRDFLFQKGIRFSFSDIIILLSFYIDERERLLTYGSISVSTNSFSKLSGADFERLLYRLYEAMGYSVQIIGGVGDQGGDLIATKNQERILIQAKRWNNNVSNKAVQEAVAARNYYDCNKAIVVATNSFTKEATELARANGVELISKEILQKLLFDYLGESWN
ncbi:MAG: restriction endonuclease [Patescibacteria group bacterium]|nr:restriction endonuclease [Patescibacteria group bacterium]